MNNPPQSLLALIFNSSNDAIMSTDINGIIASWNPAAVRMYGYSPEEIIGHSFFRLVKPENFAWVNMMVEKVLNKETVESFETIQIKKDGTTFPLRITVSTICDENGLVVGASAIARDITHEKDALQNARNMATIVE